MSLGGVKENGLTCIVVYQKRPEQIKEESSGSHYQEDTY